MFGYVWTVDFDGTVADTFSPSPNGVGVNEAYLRAVQLLYGDRGVRGFVKVGGLSNRAPGELIQALSEEGDLNLSAEELRADPERLVQAKLDVLLQEIGPAWPRPCTGFLEFCSTLRRIRRSEGIGMTLAILSSGHTAFIEKTFAVWKSQWAVLGPNIIVSDDDVRHLDLPTKDKVKPAPFLLSLVKLQLGTSYHNQRAIYIGDDAQKDGMLAINSGVPFGWFSTSAGSNKPLPAEVTPSIIFNDWRELAQILNRSVKHLREGVDISTIF
ncbi:HAD family hydrolase [Patescibacteria group bacterium]|nr:MAG: HAD family hydrolase [Patescibacteria group bacterium]